MAVIRLKKICKDFNIGLDDLVKYLNSLGAGITDINPNCKVSEDYLPALKKQFGKPEEMVPAARSVINTPVKGTKYMSSIWGKRILLLDGFHEASSSQIRDYYIDAFSNNDVFSEGPETLLAAGKTISGLFGLAFDIVEFMDSCAFFNCDKEVGIQDEIAYERRRQKIQETVELLEPEIVLVISQWVKDTLRMNSGLVIGNGHLLTKRMGSGHLADYVFVKDPFWLSDKDWEGLLCPGNRDNGKEDAVSRTKELFQDIVCDSKADFFSFTCFGYAENLQFESIRKVFDFLVEEKKIDDTNDNLLLLIYRLTGKLLPESAHLSGKKIQWKGSWKGHTFISFIRALVGGETSKGKPWVHAANAFCFLSEDGGIDNPNNTDLSEESKRIIKSQSTAKNPFIERFKRLFPSIPDRS